MDAPAARLYAAGSRQMNRPPLPPVTIIYVSDGNWGWQREWKPGTDLLLLCQGAELARDSLSEMTEVLHRHERHGAVSPRTSIEGPFSLPPYAALAGSDTALETWKCASRILERYAVVPSALPECVLIRSQAFEWFGPFDDSFDSFAAALEDFVCRMNRRGFSVVAANRAFLSSREQLNESSEKDRDTLLYRYPEYEYKLQRFEEFDRDPIERFAGFYRPHRPRILYDLFHLTENHSGTSEFGLSLLAALATEIKNHADLFVGAHLSNRFFLPELAGYRIYDDTSARDEVFDLAFKPCQILSWADFQRLDGLAPRMAFTLQDIIGIRCNYLNSPERQLVLEEAAQLADAVFTISNFTGDDFSARFGTTIPFRTIYHGTNFAYTEAESLPGEHVLIVGNNFAHKALAEAIEYLPVDVSAVVLGCELATTPKLRSIASGSLSRQHLRDLFSRASVLIYPSYYEGFGLPVIDALALGKPVIVLDTRVNRELEMLVASPNLHRIATFRALPEVLKQIELTQSVRPLQIRRWSHAAAEYATAFRELLARDIDLAKVRARRTLVRAVGSGR
jgi:glycosyltransferase involved in cell wall biosynthesis